MTDDRSQVLRREVLPLPAVGETIKVPPGTIIESVGPEGLVVWLPFVESQVPPSCARQVPDGGSP